MAVERFSDQVADHLKFYVYRLIDPRNGETFYVGKGRGNRVFAHARGEIDKSDDAVSEKLKRILDIRASNFEVAHVIHRHGLTSEVALEVEAALMDAYSGVTNLSGGHGSGDRGVMHVSEIIEKYEAREADFTHKLVAITINRSVEERSIYEGVRYAWKLDARKAARADYILAVRTGIIVGAFKAYQWLPATIQNFPGTQSDRPGRWGFIGEEAPTEIKLQYLRARMPDSYRKKGAANPVRYIGL